MDDGGGDEERVWTSRATAWATLATAGMGQENVAGEMSRNLYQFPIFCLNPAFPTFSDWLSIHNVPTVSKMLAALWSSDLYAGDHHELRSLPQRAELILCMLDPRIYPTGLAPENPMAIMTHTNVPGTNTKHDNTSLHPLPFHQYTLMTSNAPGKRRAKSQSRVRKHAGG